MTIEKILELVDSLAPNNCTDEQKLYWYNQCESIVSSKIIHKYRYIETYITAGIIELPEGYNSDDIEAVYVNGKICNSYGVAGFTKRLNEEPVKAGVVLRERFEEAVRTKYEGSISFSGSNIVMHTHPFVSGDTIYIESTVFTGSVKVLGTSGDVLYTSGSFSTGSCVGKAKKLLEKNVNARMPYDRLYIDYIMAQMDYYNKDYEGYNNNMYIFNELLDELVRANKSKAPAMGLKQLIHIW